MELKKYSHSLLMVCISYATTFTVYAHSNYPDRPPVLSNPLTDVSEKFAGFIRDDDTNKMGGAAWFDYNNDGHLDAYITTGNGRNNALFRNNADGSFTDVALSAGVANGQGNTAVVPADINNDGCEDIFLSGEGSVAASPTHSPVVLYLNNCDGSFSNITAASGIADAGSSFGAAFGDINNDGYLDLFIANAGSFSPLRQDPNQLFLNNGDNTFTDISASSGVNSVLGGCVVAFSDYNADGLADIIVGNCNDVTLRPLPLELWHNNGDLTFTDVAASNGMTRPGFWMSLNVGDIDNDGNFDIFSTSLGNLPQLLPDGSLNPNRPIFPHLLHLANGDNSFTEIGQSANIEANSNFSWGASLPDLDNDGYLDLIYQGNWPLEAKPFFPIPPPPRDLIGLLGNPGRMFINNRDQTFTLVDTLDLEDRNTSGMAVGDYNNDGFTDVLIVTTTSRQTTQEPGSPILLENTPNGNNWATIRLVGTESNRSAVGAVVTLKQGQNIITRQVHAGTGFLSADTKWLNFGLGKSHAKKIRVNVKWPSGLVENFTHVHTRKVTTLVEGKGKKHHPHHYEHKHH